MEKYKKQQKKPPKIEETLEPRLDAEQLISGLEELAKIKLTKIPQIDGILNNPGKIAPTILSSFTNYSTYMTPHIRGVYSLYNTLTEDIEQAITGKKNFGFSRSIWFLSKQGVGVEQINKIFFLLYKATQSYSCHHAEIVL
jgi:hypothetical protein